MKIKLQFFALFFLLSATGAVAQTSYFEILPATISIPDSIHANDSLLVSYYCKYHDPTLKNIFNGIIFTNYITGKDSSVRTCNQVDTGVNLVNNDSVRVTGVYIPVNSKYFRNATDNIIVVWPTGGRSNGGALVPSKDSVVEQGLKVIGLAG